MFLHLGCTEALLFRAVRLASTVANISIAIVSLRCLPSQDDGERRDPTTACEYFGGPPHASRAAEGSMNYAARTLKKMIEWE
jgi:hypothetical protein